MEPSNRSHLIHMYSYVAWWESRKNVHTRAHTQTCTRASVKFCMGVRGKLRMSAKVSECATSPRVPLAHAHTGENARFHTQNVPHISHRMWEIFGGKNLLRRNNWQNMCTWLLDIGVCSCLCGCVYVDVCVGVCVHNVCTWWLDIGHSVFCEALVFLHICK